MNSPKLPSRDQGVWVSTDGGETWEVIERLNGADAMGWAFTGDAADEHVVPPPPSAPPDVELLAAIAARHGTTIVGPPIGQ